MPTDHSSPPADERVVLGIHTNAVGNADPWSVNTEGHAWLTVTRGDTTQAFGLWPNDHPRFANEAHHPESNIRKGIENAFPSTESRYYELDKAQVKELDRALKENVTWGPLNNCSAWATSTAERVTGEHIQARDNYGIKTPADLANGIDLLEKKGKTSPETPHQHVNPGRSSSFGGDVPAQAGEPAKHQVSRTGDPHLDALLANPADHAAVGHAMRDLARSPDGQAFQAEGQAQHRASQQAQQHSAQQQNDQQQTQQDSAQRHIHR